VFQLGRFSSGKRAVGIAGLGIVPPKIRSDRDAPLEEDRRTLAKLLP
jgi:hypothetical protein